MARERDKVRAENRMLKRSVRRLHKRIEQLVKSNDELFMLWCNETQKREELEGRIIGLRVNYFYANNVEYGMHDELIRYAEDERKSKAAIEIGKELMKIGMITMSRKEEPERDGFCVSFGIDAVLPKEEE